MLVGVGDVMSRVELVSLCPKLPMCLELNGWRNGWAWIQQSISGETGRLGIEMVMAWWG